MPLRDHILLTGATGQIGRFLLRDLLTRKLPLAVLARGRGDRSPRERITALVDDWNRGLNDALPMPVVLAGDTTLDGFGLDSRDHRWLRQHCGTLLHNAASVQFSGGSGKETWNNNVSSAHRALELCRKARIDHFAFVSTAYVCGDRKGVIFEEELEHGQQFNNEYEHSKFEAERIVRAAKDLDAVTVLRPSIVVGDHQTGQTQTYHSFYRAVQFTKSFADIADKDATGHWKHNVRLNRSGNEICNLVTVNWVSAAISMILARPETWNKTFHLTPSLPTLTKEMEQALQAVFNYDGVTFLGEQQFELGTGSAEEKRFYQYMQDYAAYFGQEPEFDRQNTDWATKGLHESRIDVDCLIRLIEFAVQDNFGKKLKRKRSQRGEPDSSTPVHTI